MPDLNPLYPVFLKTSELQILIVGGGNVALEKLTFLFKSSPESRVHLVTPWLRKETREFIQDKNVTIAMKPYEPSDLSGKHLIIATTDDPEVNLQVQRDCRQKGVLINVADCPDLCDFYMGGIVTKGNLKIAISTNGKSPTLAKRMRQWLEALLPDEMDDLLTTLRDYRTTLKGDFAYKVKTMNAVTKSLLS
ncbi:bifunctional precorrin-2 dehydrogenase/sirohydrochlorin ferrochelatase [Flavobacteriaceae bacterium]|nr:bifunctional precorrin-2 dehydrogenase/sirohydrochlorin ferrochelatase [Flavobacteriaceae bacterium]MDB4306771.1 bifunctional precorrin-2 dehydrogenase/sirohydrochlorin ferrochelatase [Flavobacteriaceae bacterium]